MNSLEQTIYDLLKDRVALKNAVKWLYQRVFSAWPAPRVDTPLDLTVRPGAFFGFHDKSPWSADSGLLVAHAFEGDGSGDQWRDGEPAEICVFRGPEWTERQSVAQTRAWNWQQGSQLQWLGSGHRLVYNDFRGGRCVGVVRDLSTNEEILLEHPIAAVSPDGARYASVCFETLGRGMPAYGYAFGSVNAGSTLPPGELAICRVGERESFSICLDDLSSKWAVHQDDDTVDFFSHCLFSPDGDRLLFLRRQARPRERLRSEMFCLNCEGRALTRMAFGGIVSHFTWLSNEEVLAYANTEEQGDGFYTADVMTGDVSNCTGKFNDRDGHPHATTGGDRIVFDTYPDRHRRQTLYLSHQGGGDAKELGSFYSPMKFWGHRRVDLHPRLREDGQYLAVDAGFSGVRSLVTARIPSSLL